jgi:hypothetical protein
MRSPCQRGDAASPPPPPRPAAAAMSATHERPAWLALWLAPAAGSFVLGGSTSAASLAEAVVVEALAGRVPGPPSVPAAPLPLSDAGGGGAGSAPPAPPGGGGGPPPPPLVAEGREASISCSSRCNSSRVRGCVARRGGGGGARAGARRRRRPRACARARERPGRLATQRRPRAARPRPHARNQGSCGAPLPPNGARPRPVAQRDGPGTGPGAP